MVFLSLNVPLEKYIRRRNSTLNEMKRFAPSGLDSLYLRHKPAFDFEGFHKWFGQSRKIKANSLTLMLLWFSRSRMHTIATSHCLGIIRCHIWSLTKML